MKNLYKFLFCFVISVFLAACSSVDKASVYKDMGAEQIYNKGKEAAKKGRFESAVKDFEALEARYPYGEYTDKGQLAIIHAYHEKGEAAQALAATDRFIRMHPKHKDVDYAFYMKGIINYNENYSAAYKYFPLDRSLREQSIANQAFNDFKVFIKKFPNSKYTKDAHQRMIHLRNQMAQHELHIADYYMSQKAYLAAANRAGYVVENFNQTEAVPKALEIMAKSYQALNMPELAKDADAISNRSFK